MSQERSKAIVEGTNRAQELLAAGDHEAACLELNKLVSLDPANTALRAVLASVLTGMDRIDDAILHLKQVVWHQPSDAATHNSLGHLFSRKGRSDLAIDEFRQAVKHKPSSIEYRANMALELSKAGFDTEAECVYRDALRLGNTAHLSFNYGAFLGQRRRLNEAIVHYTRAIGFEPFHVFAHFNRAISHLLLGEYEAGWSDYEWRFKYFEMIGQKRPDFGLPYWYGESPKGKKILVYSEQGVGDLFQFVRWTHDLRERGAYVVLYCPLETATLFMNYPDVDAVVTREEDFPKDLDYHVSVMSLPYYFGMKGSDCVDCSPYLFPSPVNIDYDWSKFDNKLKVGICWAGGKAARTDSVRSTYLYNFKSLLKRPDIQLFSLQKDRSTRRWGDRNVDLGNCFDYMPIEDLAPHMVDFNHTANLIQKLDLVITVDTSVAHLAGAMRRPTWVLLPHTPDFRWRLNGNTTPWYGCMSLFRQNKPGDWGPVFDKVVQALNGETEVEEFFDQMPAIR